METARIRFLETRVVDDNHRGTVRETRFDAGDVYELDVRSADRWVKRGAARFLSDDDERRAGGASNDVALNLTDKLRKDPEGPGGNPGEVIATGERSTEDLERSAIADRMMAQLVADRAELSPEEWAKLSPAEQLEHFRTAEAELDEYRERQHAGPLRVDPFDHDGDGRPGGSRPHQRETVESGLPDTDGDLQGDADPASSSAPTMENTASGVGIGIQQLGSDLPPAIVNFDAMTDEQLRDHIDQRDGRRPRRDASRESLLVKAKEGAKG